MEGNGRDGDAFSAWAGSYGWMDGKATGKGRRFKKGKEQERKREQGEGEKTYTWHGVAIATAI